MARSGFTDRHGAEGLAWGGNGVPRSPAPSRAKIPARGTEERRSGALKELRKPARDGERRSGTRLRRPRSRLLRRQGPPADVAPLRIAGRRWRASAGV
ncbi:hypothetical protein NL676_019023 [Syzygium grande]|nr:hypothetical protein NL676_019023 [Syzygium grande]